MIPARMTLEACTASIEAAHERLAARPAGRERRASLFKGAELSRLTEDWAASMGTPDDELRWSLQRLRARARDLARNNPWVRQFLRLLQVNVIGPCGMTLQADIRDPGGKPSVRINNALEDAWGEWSRDVTLGVPMDLVRFEQQQIAGVGRDGEAIIRLWRGHGPWGLKLEGIDPDLLDDQLNQVRSATSNEIRMGVEMDRFGRPVAYWIWDTPQSFTMQMPRRRLRIPADEIIHLYDPERVNLSRGITWLLQAMYALKMLDGMDEAELVAVRVAASAMGFFEKKDGSDAVPPTPDDGSTTVAMNANPGTFGFAPDGYELKTWDPQHPNAQYPAFMKTQLRRVASALGVSYNALANDLESVNYSSLRSGALAEREVWRSLQEWWVGAFRDRIYAEWVQLASLTGTLSVDGRVGASRLYDVRWVPRGWSWVDPVKDTQSAVLEIQHGLASRRQVLAEQGVELDQVLKELAAEKQLADALGVTIDGPSTSTPAAPTDATVEDPAPATARLLAIGAHA